MSIIYVLCKVLPKDIADWKVIANKKSTDYRFWIVQLKPPLPKASLADAEISIIVHNIMLTVRNYPALARVNIFSAIASLKCLLLVLSF